MFTLPGTSCSYGQGHPFTIGEGVGKRLASDPWTNGCRLWSVPAGYLGEIVFPPVSEACKEGEESSVVPVPSGQFLTFHPSIFCMHCNPTKPKGYKQDM
jgi:hypothetical protein